MIWGNEFEKKIIISTVTNAVAVILAGCTEFNQPIYENSEGFWNKIYCLAISFFNYITLKIYLVHMGSELLQLQLLFDLFFLPLMIKQTKSSKKMQEIQPELKELKEKYKSKDAVTQQKYQARNDGSY